MTASCSFLQAASTGGQPPEAATVEAADDSSLPRRRAGKRSRTRWHPEEPREEGEASPARNQDAAKPGIRDHGGWQQAEPPVAGRRETGAEAEAAHPPPSPQVTRHCLGIWQPGKKAIGRVIWDRGLSGECTLKGCMLRL